MHIDEFLRDQHQLLDDFANRYKLGNGRQKSRPTNFRPEHQWLTMLQEFVNEQNEIRLQQLDLPNQEEMKDGESETAQSV